METLFFLEAKCEKCGKIFYPRYDLGADGYWVLTYGVSSLPLGQKPVGSNGPDFNIDKRRVGPQYKCPWCGNTSFVKCGYCGKITCYDDKSNRFHCIHCDKTGEIGGTISEEDIKKIIKSSGSGQL